MSVAIVLTGITFMFAAIRVGEPLGAIISVSVMRLMKTCLVDGLGHALYAHEEQGDKQQLYDFVTHSNSLHNFHGRLHQQFTNFTVLRAVTLTILSKSPLLPGSCCR